MTFSQRILVGLGSGVAVGLFFGDLVAPLKVVADGFVRLLQMTVLPYVTVSIIVSLGSLDFAEARRLGMRAGAVLVGLWGLALGYAFLFPLVFPPSESASFFSNSLLEQPAAFDFVGLYIPSNPFHSLANNIVPAVVLFSVIVGLALIGVERKAVLLDVLGVAGATIARATRFVVRLTPYGIFALAAVAAGTLSLEQLERIQVYLVTYVAIALLVALWVLPGLVAALTTIPYREVLGPMRDALITAFLAGDLFIVLPLLIESSKGVLARHGVAAEHATSLPDVIVPASFNFPHTGKLLSISFVLFAGWFADAAVPLGGYPQLALTGLLSFFGSLNAAVPFLLDLFRIPADTFQLFLATSVVNSRFGTLAAAMHTVAVALIGSAAVAGAVTFDARRVGRYVVTTLLLTAAVVVGLRVTFRTLLAHEFRGTELVYGMTTILEHEALGGGRAARRRRPASPGRARARRHQGAGHPARGLRRRPAAVRVPERGRGPRRVRRRTGPPARARPRGGRRVRALRVGRPPGRGREGLVRHRDRRAAGHAEARARHAVLAVLPRRDAGLRRPRSPAQPLRDLGRDQEHRRARRRHPAVALLRARGAEPAPRRVAGDVSGRQRPVRPRLGVRGGGLPAERGAVLTMLHPAWTVVVPQPGVIKLPLAFPVGRRDERLARFIDTWIDLKRGDGTLEALREHWILGRTVTTPARRWSIVRDVLGWAD